MNGANVSLRNATTDGRTNGLDKAKSLIGEASAAFNARDYERTVDLAHQAEIAADTAVHPQSYFDTLALLRNATQLESRVQASNFTSSEAQTFFRKGQDAYRSAETTFRNNDFPTATGRDRSTTEFSEWRCRFQTWDA